MLEQYKTVREEREHEKHGQKSEEKWLQLLTKVLSV